MERKQPKHLEVGRKRHQRLEVTLKSQKVRVLLPLLSVVPTLISYYDFKIALDMARTLSNDPERFNEIIHRVGHMMWLTMFFLGALLLRENEIIVTQESEALIPHFAVQLELYGLRE